MGVMPHSLVKVNQGSRTYHHVKICFWILAILSKYCHILISQASNQHEAGTKQSQVIFPDYTALHLDQEFLSTYIQ
jgi:hypothetical protein